MELTIAAVTAAGVVLVGVLESIIFANYVKGRVREAVRGGLDALADLATGLAAEGIVLHMARG